MLLCLQAPSAIVRSLSECVSCTCEPDLITCWIGSGRAVYAIADPFALLPAESPPRHFWPGAMKSLGEPIVQSPARIWEGGGFTPRVYLHMEDQQRELKFPALCHPPTTPVARATKLRLRYNILSLIMRNYGQGKLRSTSHLTWAPNF